jgi:hypothetical protein
MTNNDPLVPSPEIVAWLDQEDSTVAQMIREHGWYIQYVIGEAKRKKTPIAYTIGLFGMGHPELVVLGFEPGTTAGLLNEVGRRVRLINSRMTMSRAASRGTRGTPTRRGFSHVLATIGREEYGLRT